MPDVSALSDATGSCRRFLARRRASALAAAAAILRRRVAPRTTGTFCVGSSARSLFSSRLRRTDVLSITSRAQRQTLRPRAVDLDPAHGLAFARLGRGSACSTSLSGTRPIFCQTALTTSPEPTPGASGRATNRFTGVGSGAQQRRARRGAARGCRRPRRRRRRAAAGLASP